MRVVVLAVVEDAVVQAAAALSLLASTQAIVKGWVSVPGLPGCGAGHLKLLMLPTK